MSPPHLPLETTAAEVFEREFLDARAKVLILAATLDRIDRGDGSVEDDTRLAKLHEAIQVLINSKENRAEQVQLIFSRPYEEKWKEEFGLG